MFGGFDDFFGNSDRMMNNMMNNMMNSMMGGMGSPFMMMNNMLTNDGMPSMSMMNNQMGLMRNGSTSITTFNMMPGQSVSYSSKVMQVTNDGSGKPQIYEQTSSQICGPNGIRETTETVKDSRTGLQQMKVGRHIKDRGHIKQKKVNIANGEEEEDDEYINLEEEEAQNFHNEFNIKTKDFRQKYQSISHPSNNRTRLAIASGSHSPSTYVSSDSPYFLATQDTRPPSRGKKLKDPADKKSKKKKPYEKN